MKQPQILLVDDDPDVLQLLEDKLALEGYDVALATDGERGLEAAAKAKPDLVILDVLMPGLDGLEVCRRLRRRIPDVLILLLTGKGEEMDKVLGLELGADDYLTKPFSLLELVARTRALLRRKGGSPRQDGFGFGDVTCDPIRRRLTRAGHSMDLTPKEFDLLCYLVERPGETLGRDLLLEEIWGYEGSPTTRTVDNHILRLRKKLEADPANPRHILTVHGVGYRFVADP